MMRGMRGGIMLHRLVFRRPGDHPSCGRASPPTLFRTAGNSAVLKNNQKGFKMSSGRGGKRAGAGRPAGRVSEVKVRLSQLAREHSDAAFKTLVDVCENGTSESARIAAAIALLDRGFGKPLPAYSREYDEPSLLDSLCNF